jgi:cytochrome c-type biogenesis protein CcmF
VSGQLLLLLAAAAVGGALLVGLRRPVASTGPTLADRTLLTLALIFLTGAALTLALMLAAGEYEVRYVWQHSASYQPLTQRLSALLAGQEGTFLMWSLVTAALAALALRWARRAPPDDAPAARATYRLMLALTAVLVLLTLRSEPFQSFATAFPSTGTGAVPVEGRGLNPVLQNPWMPLHTALTFLGYGLVGLAFALGLAQLTRVARGDLVALDRGRAPLRRVVRWAWLAMSLALASGLVWAFEEMTFGWYWSWDPVEAATLAIWLVLTACLHAPSGAAAGSPARALAAPFLAATAWVVVVFASFVTRSGLHPSVHAFAGGATGAYLGAFLIALVATVLVVTALARARVVRPRTIEAPNGAPMWWATGLPLALAALVVWGLTYPIVAGAVMGGQVELETLYFNLWGSLLALGVLVAMGFTMRGARQRGDRRLLAGVGALTLVAALIAPSEGLRLLSAADRDGLAPMYRLWGQVSVLAFLPPAVYALMAIVDRLGAAWRRADTATRLREAGIAVSHAGFAVVVVALTLSTLLTTSVTVLIPPASDRSNAQAGISVRALGFERAETLDGRGMVVEQRESLALEVYAGSRLVSTGTAHLFTYPERAMGRHARVLLGRGALVDTQVIFHGLAEAGPSGVPVTVRRIPLAAAVWLGALMLALGSGLSIAGRRTGDRGQRPPALGAAT